MAPFGGHLPANTLLMQNLMIQKFTKWSSLGMDTSNILKQWLFHIQRWEHVTLSKISYLHTRYPSGDYIWCFAVCLQSTLQGCDWWVFGLRWKLLFLSEYTKHLETIIFVAFLRKWTTSSFVPSSTTSVSHKEVHEDGAGAPSHSVNVWILGRESVEGQRHEWNLECVQTNEQSRCLLNLFEPDEKQIRCNMSRVRSRKISPAVCNHRWNKRRIKTAEKLNMVMSAGKRLPSVFWNVKGALLVSDLLKAHRGSVAALAPGLHSSCWPPSRNVDFILANSCFVIPWFDTLLPCMKKEVSCSPFGQLWWWCLHCEPRSGGPIGQKSFT